jgi:hypothetical protein
MSLGMDETGSKDLRGGYIAVYGSGNTQISL